MKLRPIAVTYEWIDPGGYEYVVTATERDGGGGWDAAVTMKTYGFTDPETAVLHLRHSAEWFLKKLAKLEEPR